MRECKRVGCGLRASFGIKTPQWCSHHKRKHMTNVKNPTCCGPRCFKMASFGTVQHQPLFCKRHKTEGMWNVKNKICQFKTCFTRPSYGNLNTGPLFCQTHHTPQKHWRLSTCTNCKQLASFSNSGAPLFTRCKQHAGSNDLTFSQQQCARCNAHAICHVNGLCFATCYNSQTTGPQSTEKQLHTFFKQNLLTPVYNQKVLTTCYRPDFVFYTDYGILVVENDEHKHVKYNKKNEKERMQNIYNAWAQPTHFIRFNPHGDGPSLHERHLCLLQVVLTITQNASIFFVQNPRLTTTYLFYSPEKK